MYWWASIWEKSVAVVQSREVAAKQGFLNYYSNSDAIGIKVSAYYRRSGRTSGVVVEWGSTVFIILCAVIYSSSYYHTLHCQLSHYHTVQQYKST